jgi:cytochrome P450
MQLARASMDAMINMDAPNHMQLRMEHMPYFTPAYLRALTQKVEVEVTRLLDAMASQGRCDLVAALSSQLPLFTLCEILGVPVEDRPKFLTWMHFLEMANSFAAERSGSSGGMEGAAADLPPEAKMFLAAFQAAISEMFEYGRHMLHKRRLDPQHDLMSAIARAQVDGALLADEYLDGSWLLIVFAGNDTTRNTISGSVLALNQNPDQYKKLRENPGLIPSMVSETIRWQTPLAHMRRIALSDYEVGGKLIKKGDKVVMWYVSGNRDEEVIENPNAYIIDRERPRQHISFGFGIHRCVGNRLAELQLRIIWEEILKRFPEIHVVAEPKRVYSSFVKGYESMKVIIPRRA